MKPIISISFDVVAAASKHASVGLIGDHLVASSMTGGQLEDFGGQKNGRKTLDLPRCHCCVISIDIQAAGPSDC